MPRLVGTMARTAVISGTATAVSGRVARRQATRMADRDAQIIAQRQQAYAQAAAPAPAAPAPAPPAPAPAPAAPAAPAGGGDLIEQLRQLGELRDAGILTEEEFAAQKAKLLG